MVETYAIDRAKVVHDTIDGETIIINLESGTYHSLDLIGAEIWSLIDQKADGDQIKSWLGERYEASEKEIEKSANDFILSLLQQGLIVEASSTQKAVLNNNKKPSSKRLGFQSPKLETFTDMQDFLLVDPIHEVDEEGWPRKKKD